MQTPPNTGAGRPNFMQFRRGDAQQDISKNEMMARFGPKYQLYKKEATMSSDREVVAKIMGDLKKHADFLKQTKWMYQNNPCLIIDNYSLNPL